MITRTRLTTSGNSQAVRLPKTLLQTSQLTDIVELEARKGMIIVRSAARSREGWEVAIQSELKKRPYDNSDDYGSFADDADATMQDGLSG